MIKVFILTVILNNTDSGIVQFTYQDIKGCETAKINWENRFIKGSKHKNQAWCDQAYIHD